MGALIGRRAQLRTAMGVLRRTPDAVERFGAASGVVLTGIGGIGKTALAGRVISRLRDDGWLIAVHEGRWNPTALITATAARHHRGPAPHQRPGAGRRPARRAGPAGRPGQRRRAEAGRRSPGCSPASGCWWCSTTSSRT